MKICFVSAEYPPFTVGGAGVYAKNLSYELAKLGHEVHVISLGFDRGVRDSIEDDVLVHRVPVLNKPFLKIPFYWLRLRRFFKKLDKNLSGFDLLHGNVTSDFSLTKDLVKAPRVVTLHHLSRTTFRLVHPSFSEMLSNLGGEVGLISWLEKNTLDFDRVVITRADKVIAVSRFVKRDIILTCRVPSSKVKVIYNGVRAEDYVHSNEEIEKIKKRFGITDDFLILFVGRLERRKNLPFLFKAFKLLPKWKKSKLVIVGSGKQEPFRRLANSIHISKQVIFTNFIDDVTLRTLYSACDLFVSPSFIEGLGITLLEAMAAGKPVVAPNVGGIPEVVKDNLQGKLVYQRRCDELAEAMAFFMENPDASRRIGRQNREYVTKNFSWERNAKLTEEIYKSLV